MKSPNDLLDSWPGCLMKSLMDSTEVQAKLMAASLEQAKAAQTYWVGMLRYFQDFMAPSAMALASMSTQEQERLGQVSSWENLNDFLALCQFNLLVAEAGLKNGLQAVTDYHLQQVERAFSTWKRLVFKSGRSEHLLYATKWRTCQKITIFGHFCQFGYWSCYFCHCDKAP